MDDESQFRRQINVRLDPQTVRELRALAARGNYDRGSYSPLIRELIHERYLRECEPAGRAEG